MGLEFDLKAESTNARAGSVTVRGRSFDTPAFMPVATRGSVKCLDSDELSALGYRLILMNAYHLHQRPGEDVVASLGGMHGFAGFDGAILTDSGGYQIFSFGRGAKVDEKGAKVFSPYDGSEEFLTPEDVIEIQHKLSSDILMPLDVCLPYDSSLDDVAGAVRMTDNWLRRSVDRWNSGAENKGALFGIVQGGFDMGLREKSLDLCAGHDLPGYALGGLSVGEPREVFGNIVQEFAPRLPTDKPRYLMGVGTPEDILYGINCGIDMFDCVLPTRNARNGMAFTSRGRLNLMNAGYRESDEPIDPECQCPACTGYSLGYISHLQRQKEITGLKLLTLHNLYYYKNLVDSARESIIDGTWEKFYSTWHTRLTEIEQSRTSGRNFADD